MPLYDYRCAAGHRFEAMAPLAAGDTATCPCGADAVKVPSRVALAGAADPGRPWARLADGGPEDVDAAVGSARAAFDGAWGGLSGFARAAVLRSCAEGIAAHAERLARLEVNDSGKLLREMLGQLRALPQW